MANLDTMIAFGRQIRRIDSFYGVAYSNDMKPFDLYKDKDFHQARQTRSG